MLKEFSPFGLEMMCNIFFMSGIFSPNKRKHTGFQKDSTIPKDTGILWDTPYLWLYGKRLDEWAWGRPSLCLECLYGGCQRDQRRFICTQWQMETALIICADPGADTL